MSLLEKLHLKHEKPAALPLTQDMVREAGVVSATINTELAQKAGEGAVAQSLTVESATEKVDAADPEPAAQEDADVKNQIDAEVGAMLAGEAEQVTEDKTPSETPVV